MQINIGIFIVVNGQILNELSIHLVALESTSEIKEGFLSVRFQSLEDWLVLPHEDDLLDRFDVFLGLDDAMVQVGNCHPKIFDVVPDSCNGIDHHVEFGSSCSIKYDGIQYT